MAQTGFSPLKIYASSTAGHIPSASNLINDTSGSELAINIADGVLYYKDSTGTVQVIATKASTVNVASFSGGTTGLTPNTATTGAIVLSGTLAVANGGTGVTTSTGTGNNVLSISPTLVTPILGTPASGNLSNCTFPTLNQNTTGTAAGLSTTLAVASGGTGLTSPGASGNLLTSNGTSWTSSTPASVKGLGLGGETWHDVTASRSSGTTYTNSYTYPIMVGVGLRASSSGPTATSLYVNGVQVANANFGGWTGTGCWPASAIVPSGATYSVTGGYGLYYWAELY